MTVTLLTGASSGIGRSLARRLADDPLALLARRKDLLDTLAALRSGSVPADRRDRTDRAAPLAAHLDPFFQAPADIPRRAPARAPTDAMLDQLPPVELRVRRTPLIDVLRPTYLALGTASDR